MSALAPTSPISSAGAALRPRPTLGVRDRALLALLVPLWVICFALAVASQLRDTGVPALGVAAHADPRGYPVVTGFHPLARASAEASGLRVGDVLLRVGRVDLRGVGPLAFAAHASAEAGADQRVAIRFERSGEQQRTTLARIPFAVYRPLLASSLAFVAVALLLLLRVGPTPAVRALCYAFLCAALTHCWFGGSRAAFYLWLTVFLAAATLVLPLGLRFFLRFPDGVPTPQRWHRTWPWLFAAFGPLNALIFLGTPELGEIASSALALCALTAMLAVASHRYRRSDPIERRQIKWVLFGTYCALAPVVATGCAATVDPRWNELFYLSGWTLWLIPASVLVAVAFFELFDIDRLLSATVSSNLLLASLAAAILLVLPPLSQAAAQRAGLDESIGHLILSLLLAAMAIPAYQWLRPPLERLLFRERYALEQGVAGLLRSLPGCEDASSVTTHVGAELERLLRPASCVAYARTGDGFAPIFAAGRAAPPPGFGAESPLVATLRERRRPVTVRSASMRADVGTLGPFDRAALEVLGAQVVVPVLQDTTLLAFLCLGPKRSGDIYTATDLAHLGAVAEAMAGQLQRYDQKQLVQASREMEQALRAEIGALAQARPAQQTSPPQVFRLDAGMWTIAYAGKEIRVSDMRGLHYLAALLRQPGREIHASELATLGPGRAPPPARAADRELTTSAGLGDAGEPLDARARAAYRARLAELVADQAEAERCNDLGRLAQLGAERGALLSELGAAARGQRASSHAERARVAVTKAIKATLEKIAASHPELGAHLAATVHRGYFCCYLPDPRQPVDWEA